jgi:hypothetical protein
MQAGTHTYSRASLSVADTLVDLAQRRDAWRDLPAPCDERELRKEWLAEQRERRSAARAIREGEASTHYGHERGAANCASCGRFKSAPAAICGACGDDPVSYNGNRAEFNRAHGRAA